MRIIPEGAHTIVSSKSWEESMGNEHCGPWTVVPYFEIESHPDGIEAVMAIDRELAKENSMFGRTFFACEISPRARAAGVELSESANMTVVKEIRPGFRIRRYLRVVWNTATDLQRRFVLIPNDLFPNLPLTTVRGGGQR